MPRAARAKSETGIYHIMLRGINRQNIFEDEQDSERFLQILQECKAASGFALYSYCLMGNHLHLLLKVQNEGLEQIFRRIGARFVYWYNWKYKRSGHLFQDRFKSEPIENDSYFLTVLRYLHQNPLKANLCKSVDAYKWSSYNDYIKESGITDTDFALSLFNTDKTQAKKQFAVFHKEESTAQCLELDEEAYRLTDDEARKIIRKISGLKNAADFQKMDIKKRDKALQRLKENGLSIRQIARLTGVSKGIIERII
jgi:putative transposase